MFIINFTDIINFTVFINNYIQEPVSLYGEVKVLPLAKLDQSITAAGVKKFIEEEEEKYVFYLLIMTEILLFSSALVTVNFICL